MTKTLRPFVPILVPLPSGSLMLPPEGKVRFYADASPSSGMEPRLMLECTSAGWYRCWTLEAVTPSGGRRFSNSDLLGDNEVADLLACLAKPAVAVPLLKGD